VPVLAHGRGRDKSFILRQVGGPGAPRELVLDLDEVVIGRSTQAHVSIESEVLLRALLGNARLDSNTWS